MSSRSRRMGLAVAAAFFCAAAPALAEPAFTTTLSASTTSYAWDGNPGNGFNKTEILEYTPCGSPNHDCEDVLVKLDVPGAMTAEIKTPSEPSDADDPANHTDLDLWLYESNAAGEPGKVLASTASTSAQEKITKKGMAAGYYLVRIDYYRGVQVTYSGMLTFQPATVATTPAPAVTPPAVADPAPAPAASKPASKPSSKKKKKIAACKKKAKKIKNAKKRKAALKRCTKKKR